MDRKNRKFYLGNFPIVIGYLQDLLHKTSQYCNFNVKYYKLELYIPTRSQQNTKIDPPITLSLVMRGFLCFLLKSAAETICLQSEFSTD